MTEDERKIEEKKIRKTIYLSGYIAGVGIYDLINSMHNALHLAVSHPGVEDYHDAAEFLMNLGGSGMIGAAVCMFGSAMISLAKLND